MGQVRALRRWESIRDRGGALGLDESIRDRVDH